MNKRYWFVVVGWNTTTQAGKLNMGFVSSDEHPFTNKAIKEAVVKNNEGMNLEKLVVENFIEFKNENDYRNFWMQ